MPRGWLRDARSFSRRPREVFHSMNFDTYGPFEFQLSNVIGDRWRAGFWKDVEHNERFGQWEGIENLKDAIGCYAFAAGRNEEDLKIWYVGKTLSRNGFKGEVFQKHKVDHYLNAAVSDGDRYFMFFFPLLTASGSMSKAHTVGDPAIDWLEKTLISLALTSNKKLKNSKNTKFLRAASVYGLLGKQLQGRPHAERAAVRSAFGLKG
jgi:hypothetical protein